MKGRTMNKFLETVWAWLNGNKTLFGTILLYFANQPGYLLGSSLIEQAAIWLGGVLLGGGVIHKVVKGVNNT